MYYLTNRDFKLIYTHFFIIGITQGKSYTISKVLPYHKKNDKHNLTKKSNSFHQNFVKPNLSYNLLPYPLYENLYANLQIITFLNIIIKQIFFYILYIIFQVKRTLNNIYNICKKHNTHSFIYIDFYKKIYIIYVIKNRNTNQIYII